MVPFCLFHIIYMQLYLEEIHANICNFPGKKICILAESHEHRKRLNWCVREIVENDEMVGRLYEDYCYI